MVQAVDNGFKIAKDNGGIPMYLKTNFTQGECVAMTTNTEYVIQVPVGINLGIFQKTPGTNLFISQDENPDNNSISVPTGSFTPTLMELNVPGSIIIAGKYLHFLATENTYLVVKFYNTNTSQR